MERKKVTEILREPLPFKPTRKDGVLNALKDYCSGRKPKRKKVKQ